jgi:lysophospholipase L1-like esterase
MSTRPLTDLPDPWASTEPAALRSGPPPALVLAAALVVGAAGPVGRLVQQGFHGRALVLALMAAGWLALVRHRPSGLLGLVVLVGVAAAAPLATWATIGRAPVLVAFGGVLVAYAALVEWSPMPGWPERVTPVAGLAVLPTAASQVIWFRTGSVATVALLLVVAMVTVEAYHRFSLPLARADAAFARGLVLAASALGGLVLFLTVALVLYLPGLVGRAVELVRRRRARPTYWAPRSADAHEIVRDSRRPFASTEPRVRVARHLTGLVVVAALVITAGVLVTERREAERERDELARADVFERGRQVRFSELAAFAGVDFADELKSEQDTFSNEYLRPSEAGGYDAADFEGRFTNVSDGARRTLAPTPCPECPSATVWLSGGSAAFGLGQRDEHTVASELVRLAAEDGIALTVINIGVPGYTIHQEAQKIEARLARTDRPPDLILFFNGYNDVVGTVMDSTVNGIRPDEPTVMDVDVIRRFTGEGLDPWSVGPPEQIGRLAAEKYERVRSRVGALIENSGIDALYAFQPDALASSEQYAQVEQIYEVGDRVRAHFDGSLETASRNLSPPVIGLRHLFDEAPPVFADLVHTNEEGARRVAGALYPSIAASLVTGPPSD